MKTASNTKGCSYTCEIRLGHLPVCFRLGFPEALEYFKQYETDNQDPSAKELSVPEEEWEYLIARGITYTGQTEASLLTAFASDYLMDHEACIVHAVAFIHKGKAWLITGDSGAGKSTQVQNLQEIDPSEFQIICGDRPVLEFSDDGTVWVFPSPWNGKEGWHGADPAPLEGIICLKRGNDNQVEALKPRQAAMVFYQAMIHTAITEDNVRKAAELASRILENRKVYLLTSNTIPDSSRLLFDEAFLE